MEEEKYGVSIFTPTYNRCYTLKRLYESLCRQTDKNFEWIIVDDGSKDETKEFINSCIAEKKISIRYFYQSNHGKASAHNKGVQLALYQWFTCVDSDDYLVNNAIDEILKNAKDISSEIGMIFFKGFSENENITIWKNKVTCTTLFDAYTKYGLKGDTMLIYRTCIIKKEKFPIFGDEKFVPESYLYDRLDQYGKMKFIEEILYISEYLKDGYSFSIRNIIKHNPNGYEAYIKQRLMIDDSVFLKFLDSIRYISIEFVKKNANMIADSVYKKYAILAIVPGYIFYAITYRNIK